MFKLNLGDALYVKGSTCYNVERIMLLCTQSYKVSKGPIAM